MMKVRAALMIMTVLLPVAGCASGSKDIASSYVSPTLYQNWTCEQILAEDARITARVGQLTASVDDRASGDAFAMGVGMVLFWPALFFIKGNGPEAQEYARLKGEHDALQQSANQKSCVLPAPPAPAVPGTVPAAAPGTAPAVIPIAAPTVAPAPGK
ncbi:hypothetical protein HL658_13850 [Azospirillum sp. RWY-5-1]|uniref:Metal ABC transporter ATP-binding protein n=1 Tax=Azospirillum oleiclasticum TaxID=2735135 RepID=A0ABX2T8Y6_9PROT|nr:hypothetical protein [Azospirillum oleiclasticum]NYZ13632.1 hypothetical protein [Azospirillum oleiclasticum]NYZ20792.1 hypothetical protein [Azospirillum oleiclasticum]